MDNVVHLPSSDEPLDGERITLEELLAGFSLEHFYFNRNEKRGEPSEHLQARVPQHVARMVTIIKETVPEYGTISDAVCDLITKACLVTSPRIADPLMQAELAECRAAAELEKIIARADREIKSAHRWVDILARGLDYDPAQFRRFIAGLRTPEGKEIMERLEARYNI